MEEDEPTPDPDTLEAASLAPPPAGRAGDHLLDGLLARAAEELQRTAAHLQAVRQSHHAHPDEVEKALESVRTSRQVLGLLEQRLAEQEV